MTVKDRVGRVRHVAFRVHADAAVRRADLVDAVRAVAADQLGKEGLADLKPEVTAFDGRDGLLRVPHTKVAEARAVLGRVRFAGRERAPVRVETLGTSGTMRAARRKWLTGEAAIRRRPRGKPKGKRGSTEASGNLK